MPSPAKGKHTWCSASKIRDRLITHVQYCRVDSIGKENFLFVVDRKITSHWLLAGYKACRIDRFVERTRPETWMLSIGKSHLISDNRPRRSNVVDSTDSFDSSNGHDRETWMLSIGKSHLISNNRHGGPTLSIRSQVIITKAL